VQFRVSGKQAHVPAALLTGWYAHPLAEAHGALDTLAACVYMYSAKVYSAYEKAPVASTALLLEAWNVW
jgi:hypothetical protein